MSDNRGSDFEASDIVVFVSGVHSLPLFPFISLLSFLSGVHSLVVCLIPLIEFVAASCFCVRCAVAPYVIHLVYCIEFSLL